MADLSSLAGLTFSADDSSSDEANPGLFGVDFSQFATSGAVAVAGQQPIFSNADYAAASGEAPVSEMVVSVDTSAVTPFGLGTVMISSIQNGVTSAPESADIIGINGGQVLLGIGAYNATNPGDPYAGDYVLLSDTSLSQAADPTGTATITIDVSNTNPNAYSPPCFAAGTLITTPSGDVAVEAIRAGDLVTTISGHAKAVIWTGSRRVDIARHPRPESVRPIRIEAGALADNAPSRDLLLSPDHSVYVDGVLIPAKYLVNGSTVVQLDQPWITYHHIELAEHDVVLANGLASETYLETGNRANFAAQSEAVFAPHPDFAGACDVCYFVWDSLGYARLVLTGPELEAVRARLADRAAAGQAARHRRVA